MTEIPRRLALTLFFLQLSCTVFFSAASASEEEPDPALQEKADQIFRAVDETIMHLNSGVCLVTVAGGWREHTYRLTFDYAAGLYLCETDFLSRLLITPEHYYLFSYSEGTLRASVSEFPAEEYDTAYSPFPVLDARSIFQGGGYRVFDYQRRSPIHRGFQDWRAAASEEHPGGQIWVTMAKEYARDYFAAQEFDIDPERGNTVSRFERVDKQKGRVLARKTVDVQWSQMNGTWVPAVCRCQVQVPEDPDFVDTDSEYRIEWFQVNTPLSPALFNPETIRTALEKGAPAYIEEHRVPASPAEPERLPAKHAPPGEGELLAALAVRILLISLGVLLILISVWRRIREKGRKTAG